MSLVVGRSVRIGCVGLDEELDIFELRCFIEDDQDVQKNLRFRVLKSAREVAALRDELGRHGIHVSVPFEMRKRWCGLLKPRTPTVGQVDEFVKAVFAADAVQGQDLEDGFVVDRILSEFLELSLATYDTVNDETRLVEGYLRKAPVKYSDETRITNVVLLLQILVLVGAGLLGQLVFNSVIPVLVGIVLLFALGALDIYITRPREPNRAMILPCISIPALGLVGLCFYGCFNGCFRRHRRRWCVLRSKYIAYYTSNYDTTPKGVFLIDHRTRVGRTMNPYVLKVHNPDQALWLHTETLEAKYRWKRALENVLNSSTHLDEERKRFFSPIRRNVEGQWYADAKFLYKDMYHAFLNAKYDIFIAGWMVSPELLLDRDDPQSKLETVLGVAVDRGVKVHVLLYRDVEIALPNNSMHAKKRLRTVGVEIIRHAAQSRALSAQNHLLPGLTLGDTWWSHHEKVVIVDQRIAFMGGLDLAFGRYDDCDHCLTDVNGKTWPGKDFYNVRVKEFERLEEPYVDLLDRTKVGRMPWHDIHCCVGGEAARDATRHFIARWNRELHQLISFQKSAKSAFRFILPRTYSDVDPAKLNLLPYRCTKVQILRSVGSWSLTANREDSIKRKYLELIQNSQRFLYIENQFFCHMEIAKAIYARIVKAIESGTPFKVIVVIPQWPAFEGLPFNNWNTRIVLFFQHRTIDYIVNRLRERFQLDPRQYIGFYSLRKAELMNGTLISEQVYIHSKLLIVDDEKVIIGSANLNKRSMNGDRDSEVCAFIEDPRFAHDLRCALFLEHLGLHSSECHKCRLCCNETRKTSENHHTYEKSSYDLVADFNCGLWESTARKNTEILEQLLPGLQPRNDYDTVQRARDSFQERQEDLDETFAKEKLQQLCGHLVENPLMFLRNEKQLLPSITSDPASYILPLDNFI